MTGVPIGSKFPSTTIMDKESLDSSQATSKIIKLVSIVFAVKRKIFFQRSPEVIQLFATDSIEGNCLKLPLKIVLFRDCFFPPAPSSGSALGKTSIYAALAISAKIRSAAQTTASG
jgi:hypothetical protein